MLEKRRLHTISTERVQALKASLGGEAKERVRDRFLVDRHLLQYAALFRSLVSG